VPWKESSEIRLTPKKRGRKRGDGTEKKSAKAVEIGWHCLKMGTGGGGGGAKTRP